MKPEPVPHPGHASLTAAVTARCRPTESAADEADRIETWLSTDPTIARGARGLAIFSSQHGNLLEAAPLMKPVEPLAIVDANPWLEPLAETLTEFAVVTNQPIGAPL